MHRKIVPNAQPPPFIERPFCNRSDAKKLTLVYCFAFDVKSHITRKHHSRAGGAGGHRIQNQNPHTSMPPTHLCPAPAHLPPHTIWIPLPKNPTHKRTIRHHRPPGLPRRLKIQMAHHILTNLSLRRSMESPDNRPKNKNHYAPTNYVAF